MTSNQACFYKNRLSHIIEIIGPAGSGKTTLAKALGQHDNIKLIEYPPYFRKYKDIPFFARNTLETIPTILKLNLLRNGKGLARWDMALMIILQGWHRALNQLTAQNSTLVLDEGPIFYMAYLQIYGSEVLSSPTAKLWWEKMYTQWSQTLALIVLLDAPDMILIERIRVRETEHGVKTKGDDYAFKYITDLREKYEYLLDQLTSKNENLVIFRFNTNQVLLDQVHAKVIASL